MQIGRVTTTFTIFTLCMSKVVIFTLRSVFRPSNIQYYNTKDRNRLLSIFMLAIRITSYTSIKLLNIIRVFACSTTNPLFEVEVMVVIQSCNCLKFLLQLKQ